MAEPMSKAEAATILRSMSRGIVGHHQDRRALQAGADALEEVERLRTEIDHYATFEQAIRQALGLDDALVVELVSDAVDWLDEAQRLAALDQTAPEEVDR